MNNANTVLEASLDLLWAQWSELGVPGVSTHTSNTVVSPTDLLMFTPGILGDRDARLATLVQTWCAQHGARTFGSRELLARRALLPEPAGAAFDAWTGVLHRSAGSPWPAPLEHRVVGGPPVGERELPFRSDRRSAIHLRARCLLGIGVRADLVCALLRAEAEGRLLTSPELAHLGHSPRAVQLGLSALEAAGLVRADKQGRTHTFALSNPHALAHVLDTDGLRWFPWHHTFPIVFHLVALAAQPSADPMVQRVRAHAVAREVERHVHALPGLRQPPVRPGDAAPAEALLAWGAEVITDLSSRTPA